MGTHLFHILTQIIMDKISFSMINDMESVGSIFSPGGTEKNPRISGPHYHNTSSLPKIRVRIKDIQSIKESGLEIMQC